MIKLFELFAGYGSQSLALKRLGIEFENVGYCEIDKYAIQAHKALHGENIPNFGDITKVDADSLPDMDFLTYSFPCQDISVAGKGMGLSKDSGTRSSLLWECHKIIAAKKPKYLMMENVKNLVGKKNKPDFDIWLEELEFLGYNNYWKVINAKNCGIPQNRERVFCISILKKCDTGTFAFNEPFDNSFFLKDLLEKNVEDKYYLSDEAINYMSRKRNGKVRWGYHMNDYESIACTLTANMYKGIPYGVITTKEFRDKMMKNYVDEINPNHKEFISDRIRKFTPKECFRLMGLSLDEIKLIQSTGLSDSQQYKMAGNSIVVDQMFFLKNLF